MILHNGERKSVYKQDPETTHVPNPGKKKAPMPDIRIHDQTGINA